jgi:hypothetical protein
MASVHYVKSGILENGDRATRSTHVSMAIAIDRLAKFDWKYSSEAPTFEPNERARKLAPYTYVVLEVEADEIAVPFQEAGFYWLLGLDPYECDELLPG